MVSGHPFRESLTRILLKLRLLPGMKYLPIPEGSHLAVPLKAESLEYSFQSLLLPEYIHVPGSRTRFRRSALRWPSSPSTPMTTVTVRIEGPNTATRTRISTMDGKDMNASADTHDDGFCCSPEISGDQSQGNADQYGDDRGGDPYKQGNASSI